jgi:hypothetical protein
MKTLYIIGNGFDLYHGLDTKYQSFAFFLQDKYSRIHEYLIRYYNLPELDRKNKDSLWNPEWAQFEKALADLNFEEVLEDNSDLAADISAEDFSSRDWHTYQFEMEAIVNLLTYDLREAFKEFIMSVQFPDNADGKLLALERDSVFINFNYTNTLERYYGIRLARILYIHGRALNIQDDLILGHGVNPETFYPKQSVAPEGLSDEEFQQWSEHMGDGYDYSYDQAQKEILSYFDKSHKSTKDIIQQHQIFFDELKNIEKVIILGHSISDVDKPYFLKVIETLKFNCKALQFSGCKKVNWIASYYKDSERDERIEKLAEIGVSKNLIQMIKIEELKPKLLTLF